MVGSLATQGESNNDIDIVVRGEDLSDKVKEAIDFRLYRMFTDMLGCKYDDIRKYLHIHYNNAGSYTSYIPLFELTLKPISNKEVIKMADDKFPVHMKGNFDIIKKSDDRRVIAGYASVVEVDRDNHLIPKETLEQGIQTLLSDSDYANLMLVHGNVQIGKILDEYNGAKTHVNDKGLYIVAELRRDLSTAQEVWKLIQDDVLNAFSISGEVLLSHDECDDKSCVRIIDRLNIYEVSVCECPVNKNSGFIVVSKAHEVFDDVINKSSQLEVKEMTKEKDCDCKEDTEVINKSKDDKVNKSKEEDVQESEDKSEDKIEESEEIDKQDEDEEYPMPEDEEEMAEDPIAKIERRLEALEGMIQELASKEEDMPEDEEMAEDENEEEEEPTKYPYPSKKDFDDLKNSISNLVKSIKTNEEVGKLEMLIKSKDDEISGLAKKVETLEKSEETPQTETEVKDEEEAATEDENESKKDSMLSRDSLGTGVWYRNPDY
jgi:HK97 family phage prohead protease